MQLNLDDPGHQQSGYLLLTPRGMQPFFMEETTCHLFPPFSRGMDMHSLELSHSLSFVYFQLYVFSARFVFRSDGVIYFDISFYVVQ